jgi:hypothetical protein
MPALRVERWGAGSDRVGSLARIVVGFPLGSRELLARVREFAPSGWCERAFGCWVFCSGGASVRSGVGFSARVGPACAEMSGFLPARASLRARVEFPPGSGELRPGFGFPVGLDEPALGCRVFRRLAHASAHLSSSPSGSRRTRSAGVSLCPRTPVPVRGATPRSTSPRFPLPAFAFPRSLTSVSSVDGESPRSFGQLSRRGSQCSRLRYVLRPVHVCRVRASLSAALRVVRMGRSSDARTAPVTPPVVVSRRSSRRCRKPRRCG